jgi:hypothetical protein
MTETTTRDNFLLLLSLVAPNQRLILDDCLRQNISCGLADVDGHSC